MIAEVSGLADVLLVFTSALMSLLFSGRMLHSFLVYHIGQVKLKKDEKKQLPNLKG
jgi:hypothetical protein